MASIPGSVSVSGFVAPTDSTDTFPSHTEEYGRGGYRTVTALAERDSITASRRRKGMLVYVIDDDTTYQLDADLTTWLLAPAEKAAYGAVSLKRVGYKTLYYTPAADTSASRMLALKAALQKANTTPSAVAVVTLVGGQFLIPAGQPMTTWVPSALSVTVVCEKGASHYYDDDNDATFDVRLFTGARNLLHFGVTVAKDYGGAPFATDSWKPLQAAANSLSTIYPGPPDTGSTIALESGRILRFGKIIFPPGKVYTSRSWYVSPTVWIEGESSLSNLYLLDYSYDDPTDTSEHYLLDFDFPVGASLNNLFNTRVTGVSLRCLNRSRNRSASGLRIGGGQLTFAENMVITQFGRYGIYADGFTFKGVWVTDCGRSGVVAKTGGIGIGQFAVEHCNPNGDIDPATSEPYAQIKLDGGFYSFCEIQLEQSSPQTGDFVGIHVNQVTYATFESIILGNNVAGNPPYYTVLRITGLGAGVSSKVVFAKQSATLVKDDSFGSPAGAYVDYTVTGQRCTYSQITADLPAGRTINNVFTGSTNTFNRSLVIGDVGSLNGNFYLYSNLGNITMNGGSYVNTRATSYFNESNLRPHNWNNGAMTLTTTGTLNLLLSLQIAGTKVVGARETGWAPMTGTGSKAAFAAYTAPTISASPTQAEVQAIADNLAAINARFLSLDAMLVTHGLKGA